MTISLLLLQGYVQRPSLYSSVVNLSPASSFRIVPVEDYCRDLPVTVFSFLSVFVKVPSLLLRDFHLKIVKTSVKDESIFTSAKTINNGILVISSTLVGTEQGNGGAGEFPGTSDYVPCRDSWFHALQLSNRAL